jgi:hypothetical protein
VIGAGISGTPTARVLTPAVTKFDPAQFLLAGQRGTETFLVVITDRAPVQKLEDLFQARVGDRRIRHPAAHRSISRW